MTKRPSAAMARAYGDDARAIASWCRAHGFIEDAEAMEAFAQRVEPLTLPLRNRWLAEKAS